MNTNSKSFGKLMIFLGVAIAATILFVSILNTMENTKYLRGLEKQNADLQLQVRNLSMMVGENAKWMTLQNELVGISKALKASGKDDLGIELPNVARKVFELEERYRDDGITASLILALVETESSFSPTATSTYTDEKGNSRPLAYGLTQVIRSTASPYLKELGYDWHPNVLYDPCLSLEIGIRHLVDLHRQYVSEGLEFKDEFQWAILSYMWGERPVKESMRLKPNERGYLSLNYWTRVREAQLRWKERGIQ